MHLSTSPGSKKFKKGIQNGPKLKSRPGTQKWPSTFVVPNDTIQVPIGTNVGLSPRALRSR